MSFLGFFYSECVDVAKLWRLWFYRAYVNFSLAYRDSKLGIVWPLVTVVIVVSLIGTIWSVLLQKKDLISYFVYLICGYPVWGLLSGAVSEGCRPINIDSSGNKNILGSSIERAAGCYLKFLTVSPLIVLAVFVAGGSLALFLVPLILMVGFFWVAAVVLVLILLVTKVPDLKYLIQAFMRIAFLITPIIWEVERLGVYQKYVWLNPFYLPLEAHRSLFLSSPDAVMLVIYFLVETVLLLLLGLVFLALLRPSR